MEHIKNYKYKYLSGAVILVLLMIIFSLGGDKDVLNNNEKQTVTTSSKETVTTKTTSTEKSTTKTTTSFTQGVNQKCNLKISYPASGSSVSFPLTLKGTLDIAGANSYPCVWEERNGLAGTVQVYYKKSGTWVESGIPVSLLSESSISTSTLNVKSSMINMNSFALGVFSGNPIKLLITDNNVRGGEKNTLEMIVYQK